MHLENTRTTVENTRTSSPDFTRMQAQREGKEHQTSRMTEQKQATYHSLEIQARKELGLVQQQDLTARRGIVPQKSQETLILGIYSKLKGGTIRTDKPLSAFFTEEEMRSMYQYQNNAEKGYKGSLIIKMYSRIYGRSKSKKSIYSEEDIIENLNKTRQGTEYKDAFGYNTAYDPNGSVRTENHEEVGETSQPENEADRSRHLLLQSLAQHYTECRNGSLHFSHFEASVSHFNYARKTDYNTDEMVHLLNEEGYLTS